MKVTLTKQALFGPETAILDWVEGYKEERKFRKQAYDYQTVGRPLDRKFDGSGLFEFGKVQLVLDEKSFKIIGDKNE